MWLGTWQTGLQVNQFKNKKDTKDLTKWRVDKKGIAPLFSSISLVLFNLPCLLFYPPYKVTILTAVKFSF